MSDITCQVAVIGAGPYGLSAAAHLREGNTDVCLFGEPMEFWQRHMPAGMILRSSWHGCHVSHPARLLTPEAFERMRGVSLRREVRLEDFVAYGRWFQHQAIPAVDHGRVIRVDFAEKGFRLLLNDGRGVTARRVVIACGLGAFARRPRQFDGVDSELASHTSDQPELRRLGGMRVVVLGAGQSAIESAALLSEAGAEVEVIMRAPSVRWLRHGSPLHTWLHSAANPLQSILYSPANIGPPGLNWVVETPQLFRRLPRKLQSWVRAHTMRPAAAGWLRPRTQRVRMTTGRVVASVNRVKQQLRLKLDDDTHRYADHVLLATGYRIDVARYGFLSTKLLNAVERHNGYPVLNEGFESSVPGLHFLGAPAAHDFGPLMGFVGGTRYASTALTRYIFASQRQCVGAASVAMEPDPVARTRSAEQSVI